MVGVTKMPDAIPETVELKVYGRRRHYVATKSLHQSQEKLETTNEYSLFRYRVIINEEWISRLLSYGHDLEVIAPDWLRERIKEDIQKMSVRYIGKKE
jgi:predicted DNA-binding transcriptional regulator YafY